MPDLTEWFAVDKNDNPFDEIFKELGNCADIPK